MPRVRERPNKQADKLANIQSWMIQPATQEELWWRHGCWWARRQRVRAALARTGANDFQLNRFDECGADCVVEYSKTLNKHRCRASYCKNRHCQPCANAKANLIARNLRNELANAKKHEHRFITLTLAHTDAPLVAQLQKLFKSFKKLRETKLWKKSQDGGCFMLEVKHNGRHWHPHLHVISAGRWLNKFELSAAWKKITGDSEIVDVRAIDQGKDVVHYVCRYIAKGSAESIWSNDETADEFVIATRHVRACNTFGKWRRFRLLACQKLADDWQTIGRLTSIWNAARSENAWAMGVLQSLLGDVAKLELE